MSELLGRVYSHTVIRVPGMSHSNMAPFVLLLVELPDGKRIFGHFQGNEPPPVDAPVVASGSDTTPVFRTVRGSHET